MVKRILLLLMVLSASLSLFADKTLDMKLDLATSGEGDNTPWSQTFGFTKDVFDPDTGFTAESNPTEATDLVLDAVSSTEGSDFSLTASGSIGVYWKIVSPDTVTIKVESEPLTEENVTGGETIDWYSTWTTKSNKDGYSGSSVTLGKTDSSSGDYEGKTVFIHEGTSSVGSYGYTKLDIKTLDASGNKAANYKATLTLKITTDKNNAGGGV